MTTKHNQTWRTPAPVIYKGYLIDGNILKTAWYVRKDGVVIATCPSIEAAKKAIDTLFN